MVCLLRPGRARVCVHVCLFVRLNVGVPVLQMRETPFRRRHLPSGSTSISSGSVCVAMATVAVAHLCWIARKRGTCKCICDCCVECGARFLLQLSSSSPFTGNVDTVLLIVYNRAVFVRFSLGSEFRLAMTDRATIAGMEVTKLVPWNSLLN